MCKNVLCAQDANAVNWKWLLWCDVKIFIFNTHTHRAPPVPHIHIKCGASSLFLFFFHFYLSSHAKKNQRKPQSHFTLCGYCFLMHSVPLATTQLFSDPKISESDALSSHRVSFIELIFVFNQLLFTFFSTQRRKRRKKAKQKQYHASQVSGLRSFALIEAKRKWWTL